MKIEDVLYLINFRRRYFPHLERQVRDLDGIASIAMVSGLVAYGWKLDELSACQGLVAKKLKQHADLSRLSHQQLRGSQYENKDDSGNNTVGTDDTVLPISNEAERLSSLGSVAFDPSVNQPLQISPITSSTNPAAGKCFETIPFLHSLTSPVISFSKVQPSFEPDSMYTDHAGDGNSIVAVEKQKLANTCR